MKSLYIYRAKERGFFRYVGCIICAGENIIKEYWKEPSEMPGGIFSLSLWLVSTEPAPIITSNSGTFALIRHLKDSI